MSKIESHELLALGTKVQVHTSIGTVISAEIVQAIPCGTVALHEIEFTHKTVEKRLADGKLVRNIVPIEKNTRSVNYSFIRVI